MEILEPFSATFSRSFSTTILFHVALHQNNPLSLWHSVNCANELLVELVSRSEGHRCFLDLTLKSDCTWSLPLCLWLHFIM